MNHCGSLLLTILGIGNPQEIGLKSVHFGGERMVTGQIKPWEWARAKRWFLAGESYTAISRRSGRSRSVIAAHGRKHRWQEQREAIAAVRETVSKQQCLRYLKHSETILVEYVERLRVARTLGRVQQALADLE